jgi:hypothetical protein
MGCGGAFEESDGVFGRHRRPDILELFHEDIEIYFPKFGFGFGRDSFLEMVKGFEGVLEYIQHDYDRFTFIPSGDYLVVEGTSQGRMSGKSWAGGKTAGGRFCNVFKFEMAEYRACTSISIPTTSQRMRRAFDEQEPQVVRLIIIREVIFRGFLKIEETSHVLQHIELTDAKSSRRLR